MKAWSMRAIRILGRRNRAEEGLTLIELLAVIVILGIIAAVAVPVVLHQIRTSKTNTAEQTMSVIVEALNRYAADHDGQYPSGTGIQTLRTSLQNYIQGIPNDPWGNSFGYTSDGSTFTLTDQSPAGTITWNSSMSQPNITSGS
jgi:type II secretion system protein G